MTQGLVFLDIVYIFTVSCPAVTDGHKTATI